MTNEQQLRLEILELRLAMAALERVAVCQQKTIDLLRERSNAASLDRYKIFTRMAEILYNARNQNADV